LHIYINWNQRWGRRKTFSKEARALNKLQKPYFSRGLTLIRDFIIIALWPSEDTEIKSGQFTITSVVVRTEIFPEAILPQKDLPYF